MSGMLWDIEMNGEVGVWLVLAVDMLGDSVTNSAWLVMGAGE